MFDYIDYTQYKDFWKCPWYWYDKHVAGYRKKFAGQRSDALAFGALVHSGLEQWAKIKQPIITQSVIDEVTPTPECLTAAQELVNGYVMHYPSEEWEIHYQEEPVLFPIRASSDAWAGVTAPPQAHGLAKIDAFFYNPTQCTVESGLPDYTLDLEPGWWIREYKTKDASRNRANWMLNWRTNMQASFQMLALTALLKREETLVKAPVRGVLVCVLEKPKLYIPERKCKNPECGRMAELAAYIPIGDGKSSCPYCGFAQVLKPYEPKTKVHGAYFRMKVLRTPEELSRDFEEISDTFAGMQELRTYGPQAIPPNKEACVHEWFGACEFFGNHVEGEPLDTITTLEAYDPKGYTGMREMRDYQQEDKEVKLLPPASCDNASGSKLVVINNHEEFSRNSGASSVGAQDEEEIDLSQILRQ